MFESFEYYGKWWLPENPDDKLDGRLRFSSQEGGRLFINSKLSNLDFGKKKFFPVILGETDEGLPITLFSALPEYVSRRGELGFPYQIIGSYVINGKIFIGANYPTEEGIVIKKITARWDLLDKWLNGQKISFAINSLKGGFVVEEKESCYLELESNILISFCEIYEVVEQIRKLIAFGLSCPVYPDEVKIIDTEGNECKVFSGPFIEGRARNNVEKFTLSKIEDNFEEILNKWLTIDELVKDLYLSVFYNRNMFIEHILLTYVQAVEAYCRSKSSIMQYMTKDEYKELYEKLVDIVNNFVAQKNSTQNPQCDNFEGFKERMKRYLYYGYEYSLQKKFRELTKKLKINQNNRDRFAKLITDTRNSMAHGSKGSSNNQQVAKGEQLVWLSRELQILLEVCLLMDLTIDESIIEKYIKKSVGKIPKDKRVLFKKII